MVLSIMTGCPGPEVAKQPQTVTGQCFSVGMMLLLWNAVLVLSIAHRILSQKSPGVITMLFGECEMALCVPFGQQWFAPRRPQTLLIKHAVLSVDEI